LFSETDEVEMRGDKYGVFVTTREEGMLYVCISDVIVNNILYIWDAKLNLKDCIKDEYIIDLSDKCTAKNLIYEKDIDYSKIRKRIIEKYPYKNFEYMLDYLALERFSYQTHNTDIIESFDNSQTLTSIATPVVQNNCGKWEIDRNHRFFLDDIYYGVCIAKWIAEKMEIEVPTIDNILHWAQQIRNEKKEYIYHNIIIIIYIII